MPNAGRANYSAPQEVLYRGTYFSAAGQSNVRRDNHIMPFKQQHLQTMVLLSSIHSPPFLYSHFHHGQEWPIIFTGHLLYLFYPASAPASSHLSPVPVPSSCLLILALSTKHIIHPSATRRVSQECTVPADSFIGKGKVCVGGGPNNFKSSIDNWNFLHGVSLSKQPP